MIIRAQQMDELTRLAQSSFECEMVRHLQQFSARNCAVIGEPAVREIVALGTRRAQGCGFTNRGPVRFYLESMFLFGSDFDTDPQYPWVREILTGEPIADQTGRAECLYQRTVDYIAAVAGPGCQFEKDAIERTSWWVRLEDPPSSAENLDNRILWRLESIYPQKCAYVGRAALEGLIGRARQEAANHALGFARGIAVLAGLMFVFGHGCCTDPQFPWIAGTLRNTSIPDPVKTSERLFSKLKTYLESSQELVEQR
jgi:hypothetical protein